MPEKAMKTMTKRISTQKRQRGEKGVNIRTTEKKMNKAGEIAKKKFPEGSDQFYAYRMGIFKKMVGGYTPQTEQFMPSFEDFIKGSFNE